MKVNKGRTSHLIASNPDGESVERIDHETFGKHGNVGGGVTAYENIALGQTDADFRAKQAYALAFGENAVRAS